MRRALTLIALTLASAASYVLGVLALLEIATRYPGVRPFLLAGEDGTGPLGLPIAVLTPIGMAATLATALLIDLATLGYERSALRRLLSPDASARVDLFYVMLRLAGGIQLLAFVFSLGTIYYVANALRVRFGIALLSTVDSLVMQFVVVYVVNSFVFYAGHRLMHTRWLWEIHKVHHAAADMNVVTPLRNHPIDFAVMTVLYALPAGLLGADVRVLLAYYVVNGLYQALVHSELPVRGRLLEAIWITPAAHRVHHSNRPEHWNRNFGILTVWDRLCGTYHPPHPGPLTYGVEGGELLNRHARLREMFALPMRWLGREGPRARNNARLDRTEADTA